MFDKLKGHGKIPGAPKEDEKKEVPREQLVPEFVLGDKSIEDSDESGMVTDELLKALDRIADKFGATMGAFLRDFTGRVRSGDLQLEPDITRMDKMIETVALTSIIDKYANVLALRPLSTGISAHLVMQRDDGAIRVAVGQPGMGSPEGEASLIGLATCWGSSNHHKLIAAVVTGCEMSIDKGPDPWSGDGLVARFSVTTTWAARIDGEMKTGDYTLACIIDPTKKPDWVELLPLQTDTAPSLSLSSLATGMVYANEAVRPVFDLFKRAGGDDDSGKD